jgi:hypothetical protein
MSHLIHKLSTMFCDKTIRFAVEFDLQKILNNDEILKMISRKEWSNKFSIRFRSIQKNIISSTLHIIREVVNPVC